MLPERKGLDLFTWDADSIVFAEIRVGLAAMKTARKSSRHDGAGKDGSANKRVLHVEG